MRATSTIFITLFYPTIATNNRNKAKEGQPNLAGVTFGTGELSIAFSYMNSCRSFEQCYLNLFDNLLSDVIWFHEPSCLADLQTLHNLKHNIV